MNASASTLAVFSKRHQNFLLPLLLIVGTLIFVMVPTWQLIVDGPFSWHILQPQFWQGGIEAIALIALLCGTQLLARPALRLALSVLIAEIYLRRYAIDASVAIDVAYFELAIGLGAFLTRLVGAQKPDSVLGYLRCFVLGLCVWSACAWIASAFGFGTLHDLRWLTLLLLPFALAARSRPWIAFVHERIARMPRAARVSAATLAGWMLVLSARSNLAFDYDALWYGLRGDYVLVGGGSVFASMGLTAPVHYYPKLYELFLIPLSGLGNSSVISGITLLILTLIAAAAWDLLRMTTRVRQYGLGRQRTRRQRRTTGWTALTPTELEVAWLVAEGLPNTDIAARLFLSRRTVETHVSHILAKLGARSRVEIAREAARHEEPPRPRQTVPM